MAWYDTLATTLTNIATTNPNAIGSIVNALQGQNQLNAQITNLLQQVHDNPAEAGQIAATIAAMPNVPAAVMAEVNALPAVASNPMQLTLLIAQIQAGLPRTTVFG